MCAERSAAPAAGMVAVGEALRRAGPLAEALPDDTRPESPSTREIGYGEAPAGPPLKAAKQATRRARTPRSELNREHLDDKEIVMSEHFDAVVLGMGPGGEVAAGRLLKAGRKVALIERELIGGECAYWACIPSKTLLRPAEARGEVQRAAGVSGAELDWSEASRYRDFMIRNLDDSAQIDGYTSHGAVVVKGEARVTGPGRIQVGDR